MAQRQCETKTNYVICKNERGYDITLKDRSLVALLHSATMMDKEKDKEAYETIRNMIVDRLSEVVDTAITIALKESKPVVLTWFLTKKPIRIIFTPGGNYRLSTRSFNIERYSKELCLFLDILKHVERNNI